MASPLYSVVTGKVTLTASATKSLILLNPAVVNATLRRIVISMDASAAAAGVYFDVYRTATLGSPAGSSATPAQAYDADPAALSTALTSLATEPTSVTVLDTISLQPLGGFVVYPFEYGGEIVATGAGKRVGLRYTTAAGVTPDCWATFWFTE